jgi:hypothetical protein
LIEEHIMSAPAFTHDVFLSHSAKDKTIMRAVAERLRADGLRMWLDDWEVGPGDSLSPGERARVRASQIEHGLEHSRVLVLCMSANAFGSDWAQLEAGTCGRGNVPFRDPLNKERRFIPLRLDDAPIKGSLAQFLYINWLPQDREQEVTKQPAAEVSQRMDSLNTAPHDRRNRNKNSSWAPHGRGPCRR